MNVLQSWRESLSLFKPSNFKVFAVATFNMSVECYKLLIKYFWWILFVLLGLFLVLAVSAKLATTLAVEKIARWSLVILVAANYLLKPVWNFSALLAARPTMEPKKCAYFRRNFGYSILYLLAVGIGRFVTLYSINLMRWLLPWSVVLAMHFSVLCFYGLLLLFVPLFFLDSNRTLGDVWPSLRNALTMIWYNVPLLLLVWFVVGFLLSNLLFAPIGICIIVNIYIKKIHEQGALYVGGKTE